MSNLIARATAGPLIVVFALLLTMLSAADTMAAGGKPGKPTGLSATADDHDTVSLTWSAPSSGATPTEYRIFRRNMDESGSSMSRIDTSTGTSYTDDGLDASTRYRYKVAAVADGKTGRKSAKADVTTPDNSESTSDASALPHRPASLDLSEETAGQIVAVWTAPSDGPDPTGYTLYRTDIAENSTATVANLGADTLTYTDSSVAEETWYSYSVSATNDAGEGPANGPDSIKSKNQTPDVPEEITSLSVSEETAGQVVVSWTAATDGPAATGFKIYRNRLTQGGDYADGEVHIGTATGSSATSYTDSTVAANVSYEYHVRAENDAGHSGAWRRAMVTTKDR